MDYLETAWLAGLFVVLSPLWLPMLAVLVAWDIASSVRRAISDALGY